MKYDALIIGGGLAGLTCGIRCAEAGLRTAILSGGMNSLHFSSGSIDLAGYDEDGEVVKKPFDQVKKICRTRKDHPYAKAGLPVIKKAMDFFIKKTSSAGLTLNHNADMNHFHITGLGMLKPAYLSQESVFGPRGLEVVNSREKIAIMNFKGFRDYYPEQTAAYLKKNRIFADREIVLGEVSLPWYMNTQRNLHEFRSTDLARIFETEKYLPRIAEEIRRAAGDATTVSLPAFLGINNYRAIRKRLEEMTGKFIYEIPTLPPSILGLRIDHALKDSFIGHGGDFIAGERAESGPSDSGMLEYINTRNTGREAVSAKFYVLATGSFFSGGLTSDSQKIMEPVFNFKVNADGKRSKWYSWFLFDAKSHPFLSYGVETDKNFNPVNGMGRTVKNVFCAGAVLSGYDPVRESCGGGVAISSGFACAEKIIGELKK